MRRLKKAAQFALAYVAGLIVALAFYVLKWRGFVRVEHPERIPPRKASMLIVVNHPSLVEPFFIPTLFFGEWVWSPRKWGPWSTPDSTNLKAKFMWLFWIGGARNIPVPRQNGYDDRKALAVAARSFLRKVRAVLKIGGRLIFFAESGRTTSVPPEERMKSPKGHELRPFVSSLGTIVAGARPTVLPVWISYPWTENPDTKWLGVRIAGRRIVRPRGWFPIRIKIGHPVCSGNLGSRRDIVGILQKAMLALADEGED